MYMEFNITHVCGVKSESTYDLTVAYLTDAMLWLHRKG